MWGIIKQWSAAVLLFSFGCSLILVFPRPVHAFRLDPGVLDVAVNPGEATDTTFTFTNTSSEEKTYSVDLLRVTLGSVEGDMEAVPIEEPSRTAPDAPEDPANWFSYDADSFILAAGASQDIVVHIHPPASVPAQVFVLGIRLLEQAPTGSNVAIHTGAIELAFVTIGTGLIPDVQILSLDYPPFFVTSFPAFSNITLRNDGSGIAIPDGAIVVENKIDRTGDIFHLNPDGKRVPPGQTRTWSIPTPIFSWIGLYKVWLVGGEENQNEMIGTSHTVLIVSPWVIGGILVGAILFVVVLRQRKRQQK